MTEEARCVVTMLREGACCCACVNAYPSVDYPYPCEERTRTNNNMDKAADLIESLSAQLDQVTRERDALEKDFADAAKIMFMEDVPGACEVCMKNLPQHRCNVCEFKYRRKEVEN